MATNRPVTLVSGIHSVVLFRWMRQFPLEVCFKSSFETFTATGTFIPYCCNSMLANGESGLGVPIDGRGALSDHERRRVEVKAPGIIERKSVHEPMQTEVEIERGRKEPERPISQEVVPIVMLLNEIPRRFTEKKDFPKRDFQSISRKVRCDGQLSQSGSGQARLSSDNVVQATGSACHKEASQKAGQAGER
ncbi:hypothetical protein KY290_031154 [Solanum tuberosum]|uniref:Uncharacterized protein n=1 Tax=Solanum tuberosum TaxID=4113 RepID=A0ABQ7U9Y8_SOLTU|nr:hypothetical protein KY290_031154 [Solanum tuberosum]